MDFYTNVYLRGSEILAIGYNNGKRQRVTIPCHPYLFVTAKKPTEYTTIHNEYVDKIQFDTPREAREFIDKYKGVQGFTVYGMTNFVYPFIFDNFRETIKYDPSLISTVFIDIEVKSDAGFPRVDAAAHPITAITISKNKTKYVFGCGEFVTSDPKIQYFKCTDEVDLLKRFIGLWNNLQIDVVSGWNVQLFDIPYLVNRITNVLGNSFAKQLSPWGILNQTNVEIMGKDNVIFTPVGITVLDYLEMYRKFAFSQQESYKLDHIGSVELGIKKIDYSEYGSLFTLYTENYQKFLEYNIKDVEIVELLDDKLKLLELVYAFAYDAKILFQDTFTTVRSWDILIHNYLLERNQVVPFVDANKEDRSIMGGYVKDPQVGMHGWTVSFDLASLYPHLIMQYNISPDMFVGKFQTGLSIDDILEGKLESYTEQLVDSNCTTTANMCLFRKDKRGFLPELMDRLYQDRDRYKQQMFQSKQQLELSPDNKQLEGEVARYNNLQMAKKIQLNSGFGAMANRYFRWFENDLAESITSSGQLSIRWIEKKLNQYFNKLLSTSGVDYVLAIDTDSVVGDTIISVNGKDTTIADYYESVADNWIKKDDFNHNYVKRVEGDTTPSLSKQGQLRTNNINYVMKHKVRKRMYKISCKGKSVTVTEDHSIIVRSKRTKNIFSIPPSKLDPKKHEIINIATHTDRGAVNETRK
jgi:DNA polymerase elongation subunit (family B)